jgi:hypothetical protein
MDIVCMVVQKDVSKDWQKKSIFDWLFRFILPVLIILIETGLIINFVKPVNWDNYFIFVFLVAEAPNIVWSIKTGITYFPTEDANTVFLFANRKENPKKFWVNLFAPIVIVTLLVGLYLYFFPFV